MAIGFSSKNDTFMRLNKTVCFYEGNPYYIRVAEEGDKDEVQGVCLAPHDINKVLTLDITDNKFDYSDISLGYINSAPTCYFITKSPRQRQKQGLCINNLNMVPPIRNFITSDSLGKMLINDYPSFQDAINLLNKIYTKVAVHKNVAIGIDNPNLNLYYKDKIIGYKLAEHHNFTLFETKYRSFLINIINKYNIDGLEV